MSKNDLLAGLALVRELREMRTRVRTTLVALTTDPLADSKPPFGGSGESPASAQAKAREMVGKLDEDIRVLSLIEQMVHAASLAAERSFS